MRLMYTVLFGKGIQEFKKGGTRAEQMYQVEHELFELYAQPGLHEKPEQLGKRGGAYYSDAACECISAIYNDRHLRMTVSTENKGALPCLAPDSIVEVSSLQQIDLIMINRIPHTGDGLLGAHLLG